MIGAWSREIHFLNVSINDLCEQWPYFYTALLRNKFNNILLVYEYNENCQSLDLVIHRNDVGDLFCSTYSETTSPIVRLRKGLTAYGVELESETYETDFTRWLPLPREIYWKSNSTFFQKKTTICNLITIVNNEWRSVVHSIGI